MLFVMECTRYSAKSVARRLGSTAAFSMRLRLTVKSGNMTANTPQRALNCIDRIEQRFLVFLDIAIVRGRKRFHRRQHRHEIPIKPASLAACQFSHVRVFLLRHQTGVRGKRIAKFQKTEFGRAPDDQVLAETGEMHADHRQTKKKFAHEIPVTDGIDTILAHARKTEVTRDAIAIADVCSPALRRRNRIFLFAWFRCGAGITDSGYSFALWRALRRRMQFALRLPRRAWRLPREIFAAPLRPFGYGKFSASALPTDRRVSRSDLSIDLAQNSSFPQQRSNN